MGDNILELISPIPISVNHYTKPRGFVVHKNGRPTCQISMYTTAEAVKFKKDFTQYVIDEAKKQKWKLIPNSTQHFYIDADFVFPRIDMDANNYWKILLDSISDSKVIWEDDNVTCERVNSITYSSDNPHIKLKIYPVDYVGVFKSGEQLEYFKDDNCAHCSKFKNNCSILKKAIAGRLQPEIIVVSERRVLCDKFKLVK